MADHFLVRQQQIGIKLEATPGTAETLAAADVDLRPFIETSFAPDYGRSENNEVSEDLARSQDFVAGLKGTIQTGFVLKGSGSIATKPAIGKFLRACGLREEQVQTVSLTGAPSGGDAKFAAGETLTSGAKTVKVDIDATTASLRYIQTGGSPLVNTDVLTATDGDTATVSGSPSNHSWRYTPRSTGHETFTVRHAEKNNAGTAGQDFVHILRGVQSTGRIEGNALQELKIFLELTGVKHSLGAGSFFTAVDFETATPAATPKFLNANIQIGGVLAKASQFVFNLGSVVEMDPDGTTEGGTAGYDRARISDRDPRITIDPRRVTPTVFDDLLKLEDGSLLAFQFISSGSAGQIVEIQAPKCQIVGWSPGDRTNLRTANLELAVRRNDAETDGDYKIYFR